MKRNTGTGVHYEPRLQQDPPEEAQGLLGVSGDGTLWRLQEHSLELGQRWAVFTSLPWAAAISRTGALTFSRRAAREVQALAAAR